MELDHRCEPATITSVGGSPNITVLCDQRHVVTVIPRSEWPGSAIEARLAARAADRRALGGCVMVVADRIVAALDMARSRAGNPYLRLPPIENLTAADWAAMTGDQRDTIRGAVGRLIARRHEVGLECHHRALAQRARFAAYDDPAGPMTDLGPAGGNPPVTSRCGRFAYPHDAADDQGQRAAAVDTVTGLRHAFVDFATARRFTYHLATGGTA